MKTILSAMLIIGCFLLLSEASSGRFSNQCTDPSASLPRDSPPNTRFKLSVGTDYNQLQTDQSSQFYEKTIQDYFKEKPAQQFLGMKYFKIKQDDTGTFLNIQYGYGPVNVPGYLAYDFGGDDAIFTLHQQVSKNAGGDANYYVRCVSQCNGWEGYYLSYSSTEIGAIGYVWMSSKPAAFIVGDSGELAFKGQNQWYCKDKYVQTWEKGQGAQFTLVEIKGAKTFLALHENGYMYTTNTENEASEFVMHGGAMKCVASCHGYKNYGIGQYVKATWGDNQLTMDNHGRISFADRNDQFWYFVASYGGSNNADDYLATDPASKFGQQFCVESIQYEYILEEAEGSNLAKDKGNTANELLGNFMKMFFIAVLFL